MARALARSGVASRRDVERMITEGRVAVNGQVLTSPAVNVGPKDILTVDGAVVADAEPTRLWRYHKPAGLLTTHKDPKGRPTVFASLPAAMPRVISVGRLDIATEGLLLLTNDGELARSLELPSNGWVRVYRARAYGRCSQAKLDELKDGVVIDGVAYGPVHAAIERPPKDAKASANLWLTVSISEGKNREVRRVLEHVGLQVSRLIRVAHGPFELGDLPPGALVEANAETIRKELGHLLPPERLKGGRPPLFHWEPERSRQRFVPKRPDKRPEGKAASGSAGGAAKTAEPAKPKKTYKAGWAKPKIKAVGKPDKSKPKRAKKP
ncbi:MAG: pseudouridine synthase [Caulobacteraceae bacterium]